MEHDEKIKIENHNTMTNCNVFTGPVYGGVFPLPGSQPTINNFYGKDAPTEQTEGNAKLEDGSDSPAREPEETAEARAQRKEMVMKAITDLFDFDEKLLCRDNQGQRITNERLIILFRHCFGFGAHPSKEYMNIIECLWVLLMDKRNKCFKNPNEDYFRQTVLNILGYFCEKNIICGNKLVIARTIYKEADDSLAKNIERGISSPVFPPKTGEVLDLYINKLKKGEF